MDTEASVKRPDKGRSERSVKQLNKKHKRLSVGHQLFCDKQNFSGI